MFRIRPVNEADSNNLLDCYDDANTLFSPEMRAPGSLDTFSDIIKNDHVFVMENHQQPLGWISYRVLGQCLYVTGLYIRREWQRRGLAGILVQHMFNAVKKRGLSLCILSVLKNAPWAIDFYQKMGFDVYQPDGDAPGVVYPIGQTLEENRLSLSAWSHLLYKPLI